MSLISLNSKPQEVSQNNDSNNFRNNYPETLHILPRSQIALLKFIHFRESSEITISSANNRLQYIIGDLAHDAKREVILENGDYTDDTLALEIKEKMNAILHQQNYKFDTEIITTGSAGFTQIQINIEHMTQWNTGSSYEVGDLAIYGTNPQYIYIAKVANTGEQPDTSADWELLTRGGVWQVDLGSMVYRERDLQGQGSVIESYDFEPIQETFSISMGRGCLTHDGSYGIDAIPLANTGNMGNDTALTYQFNPLVVGISDLRFDLNPAPPNRLDLDDLSVFVRFDRDGVLHFPNASLDLNAILTPFTNKTEKLDTLFQIKFTTVQSDAPTDDEPSVRYAIVQLFQSNDNGNTYDSLDDNGILVRTLTKNGGEVYSGVIYTSVANSLETKYAPFVPVLALEKWRENSETDTFGCVDLVTFPNRIYSDGSGGTLVFTKEEGETDNTKFTGVLNIASGIYALNLEGNNRESARLVFDTLGSGTFTYDLDNYTFTQVDENNNTIVWTHTAGGDGLEFTKVNSQFVLYGVFNPDDSNEDEILRQSSIKGITPNLIKQSYTKYTGVETPISSTGGVVSKKVGLYLGKLSVDDVSTHPAYVKPNWVSDESESGNIWKTIGSQDSFKLTSAPIFEGEVFISDAPIQRLDGSGLMNISISELSNVKSFEGTRSNTGKTIAMVNREELSRSDEYANLYSYVAPFENYIDINNAEGIHLNLLTVQIREADGKLVQGMYGASQCVFKIRQDPEYKKEVIRRQFMKKEEQMTGQILSQDLRNLGS